LILKHHSDRKIKMVIYYNSLNSLLKTNPRTTVYWGMALENVFVKCTALGVEKEVGILYFASRQDLNKGMKTSNCKRNYYAEL